MTSSVLLALRVKSSPERAFDVFTGEIDSWWKPDSLFPITPHGDGKLAFEGGEHGRLVTRLADGSLFEIGQVTDWVRGKRLAFTWKQASFTQGEMTKVEVTFEPVGIESRVTVRHYGWIEIPREHAARHGFPDEITQRRAAEWWQRSLAAFAALHEG